MKTANEYREQTIGRPRRNCSLELAIGIARTNYGAASREQLDQRPHAPLLPFLFDFVGRESIEFAFAAGETARFHVPAGRRLVVEQLNVACWAKNPWDVHLLTQSSCTYYNLTPTRSPDVDLLCEQVDLTTAWPTAVQGSTTYTFQFSNDEEQCWPTVPPDTYVRICGHLEPVSHSAIFATNTEDARISLGD